MLPCLLPTFTLGTPSRFYARACLLAIQLACHVQRLPRHLCYMQSTSHVAATDIGRPPYSVATTKRRNPHALYPGAYSPASIAVTILARQAAVSQPCFVNPVVALCIRPVQGELSAPLLLVASNASHEILEQSSFLCMHRHFSGRFLVEHQPQCDLLVGLQIATAD